jgi:hypothetical protein
VTNAAPKAGGFAMKQAAAIGVVRFRGIALPGARGVLNKRAEKEA